MKVCFILEDVSNKNIICDKCRTRKARYKCIVYSNYGVRHVAYLCEECYTK